MRLSSICLAVLSGLVVVACQGPPNESVAEQLTVLNPAPFTFANTQVGTSSAPHTIQVNASGYSYNEIDNIVENCPDFSIDWAPGVAYKTCEPVEPCIQQCPAQSAAICGPGSETVPYYFSATFTPTVATTVSCSVTIYSTNVVTVTLTGTGTVPPLSADMQPTSYNFGDVRRNTSSTPATINVRNTGGQTLTVSNVTTSGGAFSLEGGTQTSFSVAPGASRAINVICSPTVVGGTNGTLSVANNYSPLSVPLSCTGIDSALDISPSPLTLPTTRVGEPRTQTVTLRNSGTASMTIANVSLSGAGINLDAAPAPNTVLGPNQTASATVTFAAGASGDATGTLTVSYDSETRSSQITARALDTSMSMNPSGTVDLGPVCMGQSTSKQFQIVANEQGPFSVDSISMPAGAFSVAATGLPAAIQGAGANTYSFMVAASPTDLGPQSAMLTVDTDIPNAEPQTTMIVVEGLAEGVNGSPAELDLGGVPVGSNTIGQTITITNCTTDPVALTNARIEGLDAGEFSIVDFPETPDVASTKNAEFLIIASPDSIGAKEALFKVDHPGGTVTVNLLGDGIGEDPGGDDDAVDGRPSYYACSTGHASHAWPLLLALLALRRRRATRG